MTTLDKYLDILINILKYLMEKNLINYSDFEKIDIRLGTVIEAENYDNLKNPSIVLKVDFGNEIGIKKLPHNLEKIIKYQI